RTAIGKIQKDAVGAFEREKLATSTGLPVGNSTSTTRTMCGAAVAVPAAAPVAQKYQSKKDDWETGDATAGWKCLKYEMTAPQYYMYNYVGTGTATGTFTV